MSLSQNGVESHGGCRVKIPECLTDNTVIDNGERFPVSQPLQNTAKPVGRRVRSSTRAPENSEKGGKRRSVWKATRTCVCLLRHVPEDDGGKNPPRPALYCNGWLYLRGGEAATEAQLASTFSNRLFSRSESATITSDDGKRKLGPWRVQRHQAGIFAPSARRWNGARKRRGRAALYCVQCNGCALTQREGAIFSMLVHEDERPLGAHRNQVSSTARS